MHFSDFCYVGLLGRYLRSNSKVVRNRAKFWTFALPNFVGYLAARRVVRFHELTPTTPNVIGINMLNFKPNI